MAAIFTGLGAGLARGSGSIVGAGGSLGSAATGRSGEGLSVNAATGNLVINRQDEFLSGPGLDAGVSRTYNSFAEASDGDNNDKWQMSSARRVFGLQGTANAAGSTVRRLASDGSVMTYIYETRGGVAAYWTTDGAGAHDKMTVADNRFIWTDGDSQVTETYDADPYNSGQWRIVAQSDTTGQALSFAYTGSQLLRVTTNSGEYMEYSWSGSQLTHVSLWTTTPATGGLVQSTRTRYGYDGANRLASVTIDLSPEDNSIGDGRSYTTSYTYDGSGRIASVTQTDGSRTDIAYDAAGRVATLTEVVGDGSSRVTSLSYGYNYTNVTAPDGQVTQLKFSTGGNTVNPLVDWGYGGVSREAAEAIHGEAAFKYTSSPGADWSGVSAGLSADTGDSYKFTVSLKAVTGHATDQMLGIYGNSTGWGDGRFTHARVVSGPGQINPYTGNGTLWRITGLSDTVATQIEIIRTFDRAESGGAYLYIDHPNGVRDGQALIAAGATLEKLAEDNYSTHSIEHWGNGGTTREAVGTLGGYTAMRLTSAPGADWSASSIGLHARQGETVKWRFLMQAVAGHSDTQTIGLYGNITGWGSNVLSNARIVSGPGAIQQYTGGLWTISGLSAGQATEIEIVRTYDREEHGGAYAYVDLLGGFRDGQQVIHAAKSITKLVDWQHADKQLTHIVAPPAYSGAAQQVQEFNYDKDGNLVRTLSPNGQASHFTYDEMGNVTLIDRPLGTDVRRWYDARNNLVLEENYGSNENYDSVSHYNAYAYDSTGRLRYKVTPDGWVTEYRYDGYGRVLEEVAYRSQAFPYQTVWIDEAMMNAWRDGLGDKTLRNMTSYRYDNRGNLAYSYEWATTDNTGNYSSGHGYTLTYYTYDAGGRLLAKYKTGEVGETYLYDGLDRVIGSNSGASGVTTIFFDDAATRTVMHLSSGLTKTLIYNKAGDLISEVASAPGANGQASNTDLNTQWGYWGGSRTQTTSSTGAPAYHYSSPNGDPWRGVYSSTFSVTAGETVRYRITLKSDGSATSHSFSLYGDTDQEGQGQTGQAQAVIVSGPGSLRQAWGGLWYIDGISSTQETTVEVVRVYQTTQTARAYFYVGGHGAAPAGTGVILSSPSIVKTASDATTAIGTETLNSYDKLGRLRVSLDNFDNGNRSYFVYDKAGRLVGELDDYGSLTEYKYDSNNRLIQTSRYMGAVNASYFAQLTDPNNTVTIDQLRPVTNPYDLNSWTVYDANDRVIQTIDGTGAVTAFEYDGLGRVVRTIAYGNRVSASGWVTSPPLSPVGVSANAAIDAVTRTFYDRQGNVRGVLDGEGYLTENVYDAAGRLVETIAYAQQVPAVYRATYSLGDIRANAAPSSADNRRTRYIYDGADLLRYKVDAQNRVTEYSYDAAGRNYRIAERVLPVSVANWDFLTVYNAIGGHGDDRISYSYTDRTGRTVRTTDAVGLNTYLTYDQAGNVVKTQVGDGGQARITRNWYDARGQLRFSVDAENYLTRYSYSTGGRLTQTTRFDTAVSAGDASTIQDINAQTTGGATHTSFQYDNVGQVVKEYNGNQEYTQYTYDRRGKLTEIYAGRTDATHIDQAITHLHYDPAGHNYATFKAVGEGERSDTWVHYNARHQAWRTDDGRGKFSYAEYDRRGMLLSTTDANGGVTRYQYNAFGEVTTLTDARGYTTASQYDTLGQLTRTIDAAGYATDYGYTRFGELLTVTRAGATTTFAYDKMGRVTRSTDALGGYESYSYDTWGNRTQVVNKLGGVTQYTYDKLGRMRYEWVDTTAYDNAGNVTANGFYKTVFDYDAAKWTVCCARDIFF